MNAKLIDSLVQIINSLTPEERATLESKLIKLTASQTKSNTSDFTNEPFVGMWKDREDVADSANWVRKLRQSEWNQDE